MSPTRLSSLFALALIGCSDEAERPLEQPSAAPAVGRSGAAPSDGAGESRTKTEAATLVGEYRVAGVGGQDIDLPHGITATISRSSIHVVSGCVNLVWTWSLEDARLATRRAAAPSCDRAQLPEEQAIAAALDGATTVGRTPANGVALAGENGSVLLFGQ